MQKMQTFKIPSSHFTFEKNEKNVKLWFYLLSAKFDEAKLFLKDRT